MMRRVTVPCSELVDCSDWLQGRSALEVAQLWALWDCGAQSPSPWAPLGSKQKLDHVKFYWCDKKNQP